jgi:MFS family permease
VAVNALVGGMVGQERTVLPLLAEAEFGLTSATAALTFVVAFGLTKALTNPVAGALADRYGRRPVLITGWLVGLPVPLLNIAAPAWEWVIAANVLLGVRVGCREQADLAQRQAAGSASVSLAGLVVNHHDRRRGRGPRAHAGDAAPLRPVGRGARRSGPWRVDAGTAATRPAAVSRCRSCPPRAPRAPWAGLAGRG